MIYIRKYEPQLSEKKKKREFKKFQKSPHNQNFFNEKNNPEKAKKFNFKISIYYL